MQKKTTRERQIRLLGVTDAPEIVVCPLPCIITIGMMKVAGGHLTLATGCWSSPAARAGLTLHVLPTAGSVDRLSHLQIEHMASEMSTCGVGRGLVDVMSTVSSRRQTQAETHIHSWFHRSEELYNDRSQNEEDSQTTYRREDIDGSFDNQN